MTPEHIRDFRRETHHLRNMGMVAALPRLETLESALSRMDGILNGLHRDIPAARGPFPADADLPAARWLPEAEIHFAEYPHRNPEQPSPLLFAWRPERTLTLGDEALLGLFLSNFAGDPTTNLYPVFVGSETREIDLGAKGVSAWHPEIRGTRSMSSSPMSCLLGRRGIAALTPGPYFRIGGDEVEELTDEQYRAFIERVQGIVASPGKWMIGWTEIAPANPDPDTIIQHWRPEDEWSEGVVQAVAGGTRVILSPASKVYLDMKYDTTTVLGLNWAGYTEVRDAYAWEPATFLEGVPEEAILGVEAALWSQTVGTIRDVEYLAFRRSAAVAEVAWSPAAACQRYEFRLRLRAQAPRWTALGINFYRSPLVPWRE